MMIIIFHTQWEQPKCNYLVLMFFKIRSALKATHKKHSPLFFIAINDIVLKGRLVTSQVSPNRMTIHRRMATRAPVLRPTGRKMASALHVSREPSDSQPHTRMVRVPVLLLGGYPLSSITTGRK